MSMEAFGGPSGTGTRVGQAVIIVAGVAGLVATLTTCVSTWLQAKNYRKPLLQRYVIRILLMVPIYSLASWASIISKKAAFWIDPFKDVYEAFTIYTFFQLLINFIGGERALIILMYGRKPVSHLWPMSYCLPKVDISDPHTFLAIKRGILQYTWIKPMLAIATIIMKATGTYQEGYIGVKSGYLWSGIIYNISITVSLYALAMFWVCMSADLQPFRPMPKFLCIKGIIFASYWQGFFLSILVWLGAIPDDVPGYSPDNLAAAIQDALICFEMPLFAFAHWYAFSWHDYADVTISAARMPVKYALRDAFGAVDLIQDTKHTFGGGDYEYRSFDAKDNVLAHEDSSTRTARMMAGMRYERGGKGKYWIPAVEHTHHTTPLLGGSSAARTMSPGLGHSSRSRERGYGTATDDNNDWVLDADEEKLYDSARALEFGDWNYPVITAHTADRESILHRDPTIVTASTNRHLLQPTAMHKKRRKSRIQDIQEETRERHHRASSSKSRSRSSKGKDKDDSRDKSSIRPLLSKLTSHSSTSSSKTDSSQLVDLVVEDTQAEEVERVRARKEGGAAWNETESKHYVRTYPEDEQEEAVREGYEPDKHEGTTQPHNDEDIHNLDRPFTVGGNPDAPGGETFEDDSRTEADDHWTHQGYQHDFTDERNAWGGGSEGGR